MPGLLEKRERVILADDLAGVAEGTAGEVILQTGLNWVRYWVRFDTGAERGSIHRDKLVREEEWDDFVAARAAAEAAAEAGATAGATAGELAGGSNGDGGEQSSDGGGGGAEVMVNGVTLPAHLLARSAAARERLGG